jgi:hypothetical protein
VYIDKALASYRQHDSNLYGWNRPLDFSLMSSLIYCIIQPTIYMHCNRCLEDVQKFLSKRDTT